MGSDRATTTRKPGGRGGRGGHGRGAYYKALYGNRNSQHPCQSVDNAVNTQILSNVQPQLNSLLQSIDGKSYGSYKQLSGKKFAFPAFTLFFDYIQSDAYAPPSRIRVQVDQSTAKFPVSCYSTKTQRIVTAHYLSSLVGRGLERLQPSQPRHGGGWQSAKGGVMSIDTPGQEVIERTSVIVCDRSIEARLTASLPAAGRTILGNSAQKMFLQTLPQLVDKALLYAAVDHKKLSELIECVEDQEYLRAQLQSKGLLSFVGNGSILPRVSGVSSLPLVSPETVQFESPASLRVSFTLPNRGTVMGMGIRHGVTLICGGGFNGKSTLLQAIEMGVYNHVPRDGRELVVTDASAIKIKSEEGRFVSDVDIRPFINHLPFSKNTSRFSTTNASGSTSMAASIQEALEAESRALLFDEDTCATNFLVRDGRMQQLVSQSREPITPLISRIRELWKIKSVSCVLVIGGCGDYLDVADTVIDMCQYSATDATARAKDIADRMPISLELPLAEYGPIPCRTVAISARLACSHKPPRAQSRKLIALFVSKKADALPDAQCKSADESEDSCVQTPLLEPHKDSDQDLDLDLSALDQLVSASQTRSIARIICYICQSRKEHKTMREWLVLFEERTLDELCSSLGIVGNLARPRNAEVALAINRLRLACMDQSDQNHGSAPPWRNIKDLE
ncbi:hypothetical protein H4R99_003332 [Coemansia sp. RSA 1722]|nr:hypothetical protein IWW45_003322 [Coemansia sp. RSA 485]KAJ2600445.1 hypothetical protein H4R99_003332 [Coemansia sp. RSA 1722]